jgi:hypothetical protein
VQPAAILESALYVGDLDAAEAFYSDNSLEFAEPRIWGL